MTAALQNETLNLEGGSTLQNLTIGDVSEGGLVGHWAMNEGSGSTAYDFSGNGNGGILQGGMSSTGWVLDTPLSNGAYALEFDGTNDYVSAGNGSALNITGDVTIATWFKTA